AWSSVLAPLVGIVTELLGAQDTARARARLLERLRDTGMDGRAGRSPASRRSPGAKRRSRQSMDALFRHTFCITTERYRHRWPAVETQWRAHGIKGEFFQGVDLTRVTFPATVKPDGQPMTPHAQAIIHNHLAVVRRARDENFPQVAVFEDDFVFSDAFSHFSDYLAFVPDNWDVLMLGGNWRIRDPDPVNERVVRVRRSWNAHGYIIRRRFYDTFLEFQKPMQWETDVYNGQMQDKSLGNWYGFYKDMCWQRGLDGGSVTMSILHPGQLDNFRRLLSGREVGYRFWWRHGGHLVDDYMSAFGSYQIDDSVPDHMSTIQ
ncbi:MAG TPA: hypothetical protein VK973_06560, partial [Arenicellales bacterium]|nr:hypothetical protein [Arenicellales bacterium]